jgi:class 3 adenylate cyclase
LGEDSTARKLYEKALAVAREDNFKVWYPGVISSLGNLDYKMGKIDSAIIKYNEAISISDEVGNLNNKANCYQQLATIYYDRKDPKTAMKYIQEAMNLFEQTGSLSSFSRSRVLMSAILLSDGEYNLAIDMARLSLEEGRKTHETQLQEGAAQVLYYAYMRKGDKANALDYHILYHELSEASHNEDLGKKLSQMELEANFEKERAISRAEEAKHVTEMNAQIDRQKLVKKVSVVGIFLFAIIAGLAVFAFSQKRKDSQLIADEKHRSDVLLMALLPEEIVSELKSTGYKVDSRASVLFADIRSAVDNEQGTLTPKEMQAELDFYFKSFDEIIARHKLEKVKTIGDAYLCVANNASGSDKDNAIASVNAALEMQRFVKSIKEERKASGRIYFEVSIGIHTGPLIADIVGIRKSAYDIWGDTVNVAARMQQHSEEGKINISGDTYELVSNNFICTFSGKIEDKNKTKTDMYFVDKALIQSA